jgi:hypothetical protein
MILTHITPWGVNLLLSRLLAVFVCNILFHDLGIPDKTFAAYSSKLRWFHFYLALNSGSFSLFTDFSGGEVSCENAQHFPE